MTDVPGEATRLMEAIDVQGLPDRPADWSVDDQAFFWQFAKEGPNNLWVGRYAGTSPWERHRSGDELLYTVEGSIDVTVLTTGGRPRLDTDRRFCVPVDCWLPRRYVRLLASTATPERAVSHGAACQVIE
jgi:hypothetical protein